MTDALLKLGSGRAKMACQSTLSVPIEAEWFAVPILVSIIVEYGLYPSALSHCTGLWVSESVPASSFKFFYYIYLFCFSLFVALTPNSMHLEFKNRRKPRLKLNSLLFVLRYKFLNLPICTAKNRNAIRFVFFESYFRVVFADMYLIILSLMREMQETVIRSNSSMLPVRTLVRLYYSFCRSHYSARAQRTISLFQVRNFIQLQFEPWPCCTPVYRRSRASKQSSPRQVLAAGGTEDGPSCKRKSGLGWNTRSGRSPSRWQWKKWKRTD